MLHLIQYIQRNGKRPLIRAEISMRYQNQTPEAQSQHTYPSPPTDKSSLAPSPIYALHITVKQWCLPFS
jgi:hypothetical protein